MIYTCAQFFPMLIGWSQRHLDALDTNWLRTSGYPVLCDGAPNGAIALNTAPETTVNRRS